MKTPNELRQTIVDLTWQLQVKNIEIKKLKSKIEELENNGRRTTTQAKD